MILIFTQYFDSKVRLVKHFRLKVELGAYEEKKYEREKRKSKNPVVLHLIIFYYKDLIIVTSESNVTPYRKTTIN